MYVFNSIGIALRQYLIDLGIESEDMIFVDHRKTSDGISINETGGYPLRLDTDKIETFTVQVLTKYYTVEVESKDPRAVIQQVYKAFLDIKYQEVNGIFINYIRPVQQPAFFAQEDTNLVYVCNFEVHVRRD